MKKHTEEILFKNTVPPRINKDIFPSLLKSGDIFKLEDGVYGLGGIALELFDYFNNSIKRAGLRLGATEYQYPSLISIKSIQKMNYLRRAPEILNFVSHLNFVSRLKNDVDIVETFIKKNKNAKNKIFIKENIDTDFVISPATCLHEYQRLQDSNLNLPDGKVIVGGASKCSRFEPESTNALDKLRDFTMREIVCIGSSKEVLSFVDKAFVCAKSLLKMWGLNSFITTGDDPFVIKKSRVQSDFLDFFELKYELKAVIPFNKKEISIASLNYYKDFFGKSFNIRNNGKFAHTSCLAYGLERCVYAFLSQYGLDQS
ncbi:MAG: hypothetical protein KAR32_12720, partial [Candidatus Omnitrophica bacterium]|nr:hypothetical protein [Candidatus Omnitrophota bacterium]